MTRPAGVGLVLVIFTSPVAAADIGPTDLKCEYRVNPLGIDVLRPRLSWILKSEQRGEKQTAYRVLIATSRQKLATDEGDLWDSGKVESDETIHVEYAGKPLASRMLMPLECEGVGQRRQAVGLEQPGDVVDGPAGPIRLAGPVDRFLLLGRAPRTMPVAQSCRFSSYSRKFRPSGVLNREMAMSEDEHLMLAAGSGDRGAFGALVERHHSGVLHFVHRFLEIADPHTAEDLAQEVFLAAWKAAPSFRPQAKVLTWLLRITTNVCLNYRRSSRLRTTVSLNAEATAENLPLETEQPDAMAIAREQAETVSEAIAGLPVKQRTAILLRHFLGLSYADIADVLKTSVSAVESLLFRARQSLRKTLGAAENEI